VMRGHHTPRNACAAFLGPALRPPPRSTPSVRAWVGTAARRRAGAELPEIRQFEKMPRGARGSRCPEPRAFSQAPSGYSPPSRAVGAAKQRLLAAERSCKGGAALHARVRARMSRERRAPAAPCARNWFERDAPQVVVVKLSLSSMVSLLPNGYSCPPGTPKEFRTLRQERVLKRRVKKQKWRL
jgi:hypothetical protein